MNSGRLRLSGMTAILPLPDSDLLHLGISPRERSRSAHRAALDLSIDEELVRGDRRGLSLADQLRELLAVVVDHQLEHAQPLGEEALLEAIGARWLFARRRLRQSLAALEEMTLVRRCPGGISATVAGISAIRRPSRLDGCRRERGGGREVPRLF